MRWLFLGIALMAVGLVVLGTLASSEAPTASAPLMVEDRFARVQPGKARPMEALKGENTAGVARPKVGKKAFGPNNGPRPTDVDDGERFSKRAGGEEGELGKDDKPAAKAPEPPVQLGGSFGGAAHVIKKPEAPKAPEIVNRNVQVAEDAPAEVELVEEEEAFEGDDESPDMAPPPPPAVIAGLKPVSAPPAFALQDPADALEPAEDANDVDKIAVDGKLSGKSAYLFLPDDKRKGGDLTIAQGKGVRSERRRDEHNARRALKAPRGNFEQGVEADQPLPARLDLSLLGESSTQSTIEEAPPAKFLPRMCYFENTYLGGNAAWQEQLRRVREALGQLGPLRYTRLDAQAFDPPSDAGMALTASLDHAGLQQPGRVVLQVGLQGSQRYGWRRPPLDVVLVVDGPATDLTKRAAQALLARLSPRDRLGVIEAGDAQPLAPVADLRATRDVLVDVEPRAPGGAPADLVRAMDQASALLKQAANNAARIPGSQTVLVLTRDAQAHAQAARAAAHRLQTQGAVVSVVDLGAAADAGWWAVANAGHGNFHRATPETLSEAFDAELAMLSKVVARLLRLNVRLGPHTEGVRVIGSRILGQQEVKEVKAREVATDRNLSKTMGVKANRGDDDDGIQTVIPYFYGGDSHVVLIELWVDPSKASLESAVAEISLKYKDMVNLDNATARAAVFLARRPKADTRAQHLVKANLEGFAFAAALDRAAQQAGRGDWPAVRQTLRNHARHPRDRRVAQAFEALIGQQSPARLQQALALASRQRKGTSNGVDP